jgi:hypothetical protein
MEDRFDIKIPTHRDAMMKKSQSIKDPILNDIASMNSRMSIIHRGKLVKARIQYCCHAPIVSVCLQVAKFLVEELVPLNGPVNNLRSFHPLHLS